MATAAVVEAAIGKEERVDALADSLDAADTRYRFGATHYARARVEAVQDNPQAMLSHLRLARAAGWPLGSRIHREPDFERFRADPAFRRIAAPWSVE